MLIKRNVFIEVKGLTKIFLCMVRDIDPELQVFKKAGLYQNLLFPARKLPAFNTLQGCQPQKKGSMATYEILLSWSLLAHFCSTSIIQGGNKSA
jgi:hypothetical protein